MYILRINILDNIMRKNQLQVTTPQINGKNNKGVQLEKILDSVSLGYGQISVHELIDSVGTH